MSEEREEYIVIKRVSQEQVDRWKKIAYENSNHMLSDAVVVLVAEREAYNKLLDQMLQLANAVVGKPGEFNDADDWVDASGRLLGMARGIIEEHTEK